MKVNKQKEFWLSSFAKKYLDRNLLDPQQLDKSYKQKYGISRNKMNVDFVGNFKKDIKILEVGCNFGVQLLSLSKLGFENLYGIEINPKIVEFSRKKANFLNIIVGDAFNIPFKDDYFDLVFTSGLLIHISPKNIAKVISEIYRVSKKCIWCFEYFSKNYTEIEYWGHREVLWKANYCKIFLEKFKNLKLVKFKEFPYLNNDIHDQNKDIMFLLKKQ